jgi:PRTRC genetic system protein C
MTVTEVTRLFKIRDKILPDPLPTGTLEDVRRVFQSQFPEITTADLSGPIVDGATLTYEFATKIGTKG